MRRNMRPPPREEGRIINGVSVNDLRIRKYPFYRDVVFSSSYCYPAALRMHGELSDDAV